MNHIYRIIWSVSQGAWVVCSELTKAHKKSAAGHRGMASSVQRSLLAVAVSGLLGQVAYADDHILPTGGTITRGLADISRTANQLEVKQYGSALNINWQTFNIGKEAKVIFTQPGRSAVAVNRIADSSPSEIRGRLESTGQIFLENSHGVIFGEHAQINVGGLIASTRAIEQQADGSYTLQGQSTADITNAGTITAGRGGSIALIAAHVKNSGTLEAEAGNIRLSAGDDITLKLNNGSLAEYRVEKGVLDGLVENSGRILASGGIIHLNAKALSNLGKAIVNHSGSIEANTVGHNNKGEIILLADKEHGETNVSGSLRAEGVGSNEGGFIETSAAKVNITDSAKISTRSEQGKSGKWLIDPIDITIAPASDPKSNITGAALEDALKRNKTVLVSSVGNGACLGVSAGFSCANLPKQSGHGDIFINDKIKWKDSDLVFQAERSNIINAKLKGTGTAKLALLSGVAGTNEFNVIPDLPAGKSLFVDHVPFIMVHELGHEGDELKSGVYTLQGLANESNLNENFLLVKDIDATDTQHWNGGKGFVPIGQYNKHHPYSAVFNGNGHTISHLYINRSHDKGVGLFGDLGNATIKNLRLDNANIRGSRYAGALAGYQSGGNVMNVTVTQAQVSGNHGIAAVIGKLEGGSMVNTQVADSEVRGSSPDPDEIGGLVGKLSDGTIDGSSVIRSQIEGKKYIGGLVGEAEKSDIAHSYAVDVATRIDPDKRDTVVVGGLVGYAGKTNISDAYAKNVEVEGNSSVGGLVGKLSDGTIENSYVEGENSEIGGAQDIGGLVGTAEDSHIRNSHTSVDIEQYGVDVLSGATSSAVTDSAGRAGGLVGNQDRGSIRDSWTSGKVTGQTLMLGGLVGLQSNGTISHSHASGKVFRTAENENDDERTKPHGASGGLVGIQEGKHALIEYSYAEGDVDVEPSKAAAILTVGLEAGGLVGVQRGGATIRNSYATGTVGNKAIANVGGLVGLQDEGIGNVIENSYATGSVAARENAGGLVGAQKAGKVVHSYFTGTVEGGSPLGIGGIIGAQYNDGSVVDSFWQLPVQHTSVITGTQACGTAANDACNQMKSAKTSAELKMASTFAGWQQSNWIFEDGKLPKLVNVKGKENAYDAPTSVQPTSNSQNQSDDNLGEFCFAEQSMIKLGCIFL